MTREQYKEKLSEFNSTDKYKRERALLYTFMNPGENEKILDIGCGTGEFVWKLRENFSANAFGYDVNNYRTRDDQYFFRNEFHFQFRKIFFMHSFAHIPDVEYFMLHTVDRLLEDNGTIFILTPNKDWLDLSSNPEYIADPTVVNHYGMQDLFELFTNLGYKIELQMQFGESKLGVNERILFIASK